MPCADQFQKVFLIGHGSYGEVYIVRRKQSSKLYAMKRLYLQRINKFHSLLIERDILKSLRHPGVVRLKYIFSDSDFIYYIFQAISGGQLKRLIDQERLDSNSIKFLAAELLCVLALLKRHQVVHRDIKAENIMLSVEGHLKLIDFGTAFCFDRGLLSLDTIQSIQKAINQELLPHRSLDRYFSRDRASSYVGTPKALSPQLINSSRCDESSDLWAFGCLLYELHTKETLFKGQNEYGMAQQISRLQFSMDSERLDSRVADLISKIICPIETRLSLQQVFLHPYFQDVNFEQLFQSNSPVREQCQTFKPNHLLRTSVFGEQAIMQLTYRQTFLGSLEEDRTRVSPQVFILAEIKGWIFYYPVCITLNFQMTQLTVRKSNQKHPLFQGTSRTNFALFGERTLRLREEGRAVTVKLVSMRPAGVVRLLEQMGLKEQK